MITRSDSLEYLKSCGDYEFDINYSDPPYALGSEVIIRPDGKVDYKKANDFMNKWEMPTGEYWEQWFKEAYRTLKYGGYCIMFGMDRQLLLFKYYANLAGFTEQQSLYWYAISNFPKATDLSKMIDKNAGAEREVIGKQKGAGSTGKNDLGNDTFVAKNQYEDGTHDITTPSTDLAKKYDGYKYSISPLKQTNETILIFCKPTQTGSILHDTLLMEKGLSLKEQLRNEIEAQTNEKVVFEDE
jgi:site-specific DNA-methyltransferase (adenine-specific)